MFIKKFKCAWCGCVFPGSDKGCCPEALLCAICVSTFDEQSEGYEDHTFVETSQTDNNFSDDGALISCFSVGRAIAPDLL